LFSGIVLRPCPMQPSICWHCVPLSCVGDHISEWVRPY
jgi:hypothetical protein